MEYRTLAEARQVATLHDAVPGTTVAPMSRDEKLERWAELLERQEVPLNSLHRIEYITRTERSGLRANHSALSIAFADPVLCAQGLKDDSYGEVLRFFDLTDDEAHYILCYCHCGHTSEGRHLAQRVRVIAAYSVPHCSDTD